MTQKKRWTLLKHLNAPDDPLGIHFDLLLEEDKGCRTWRLESIPILDGAMVKAIRIPMHKLTWLDKKQALLSQGRGSITCVEAGIFYGSLPGSNHEMVSVLVHSDTIVGRFEIKNGFCNLCSD